MSDDYMDEDRRAVNRIIWRKYVPALAVVLVAVWVIQSAMEAAAYNRVTGKNVSTWDAMWIELRVQEGAK